MATLSSASTTVFGDKRVHFARLTTVSNADTYVTPLKLIEHLFIMNEAAASVVGGTKSAGTITFAIETGTPTVQVMAIGT